MCPGQTPDPAPDAVPSDGGLAALLDPALDGMFRHPALSGADSSAAADESWHGHLPFAAWLVSTLQPRLLVELGPGTGLSLAGLGEAVLQGGLPTRCFVIEGAADDAGGSLGRSADRRYEAISRRLRMGPDEALPRFADGSVDLLLLDGRRRPDELARDLAGWLPKLSPSGVALLPGTNRREDADGAWRAWEPLSRLHPGFEFLRGGGLGVLAPGAAPPDALAPLLRSAGNAAATARLRGRFAALGARREAEVRQLRDGADRAALAERARQAGDLAVALEALRAEHGAALARAAAEAERLRELGQRHDRLRDELAHGKADRHRLAAEAQRLREAAGAASAQATDTGARLEAALGQLAAARAELAEAGRAAEAAAATAAIAAHDADTAMRTLREEAERERGRLDGQLLSLRAEHARLGERLAAREAELARVLGSRSWRLTRFLRGINGLVAIAPAPLAAEAEALPPVPDPAALDLPAPDLPAPDLSIRVAAPARPVVEPPEPEPDEMPPPQAQPAEAPAVAAQPAAAPRPRWRRVRRVLFVAGEPGTPGATYRTARAAAACVAAGYEAQAVDIFDVNPDNLAAADLVVLWRAAWSGHVQTLIGLAHAAGTRVAFDVDDLIVTPSLAVAEIIDGIRTTFVTEAEGRSYFQGMQRTLTSCDLCTTTTAALAAAVGVHHPVVHVLPNSHDAATGRASRRAVRLRAECAPDGRIRLGYAGGTRTHQKDFATIAGALARVLAACPETVLVLFRDPASGEGLVLLDEFPALLPLADRVEWRDMVPLAALPDELARFDVSLCPLERGNPFCEAKSELKYFESALAGACLVATPTAPFRAAVAHGVTGFLPEGEADWERTLLALVRDPALRARTARAAHHDALWQFGPRRLAELWAQLLGGLDGGAAGARASELALRRGAYRGAQVGAAAPEVPDSEVLFSYDALGDASVTVGMTSYNYEDHLGEALDSVLAQTCEAIDLVVVDDGSRDGSVALLLDWAERHRLRFNRLRIVRTIRNAGLGGARNLVFSEAETPWIMVLDSDNRLRPEACAALLRALEGEPLAAFAYPMIRQFGARDALTGTEPFEPARLGSGNYIDAMAMVAKWAWAAAGGYYVRRDAMGWEDFSLWCRLVELGQYGLAVPAELADYRVHAGSMVNAITEQDANKRAMVEFVETRHPWLRLRMRATRRRL